MQLDKFISNLINELGVPYIDVACYKGHKEVYRQVFGDGATGKELLYQYSCSKVITAVSAMKLVEDGKLSLDDRVCKYLPEVENAFILDADGKEKKVGDTMLVRHLFTMTAGFTYDLHTRPILDLVSSSGGKAVLRDFISAFVKTPLSFAPGAKFQYSICHDILAAVIEVVSGKKFSAFVKENIFAPLQMNNSYFDNSESGVIDIYFANEDKSIVKLDERKILLPTPFYESGGAGLVSTVDDYIIFADALACGGTAKNGAQILKPQTIELLTTLQIEKASVENGFTCVQGDDYGYGYGVRVRRKPTDWGLNNGEFGWDGAAGSYLLIDPERDLSVFIGMHLRNWPAVFTGKHLEIVKAIYGEFIRK